MCVCLCVGNYITYHKALNNRTTVCMFHEKYQMQSCVLLSLSLLSILTIPLMCSICGQLAAAMWQTTILAKHLHANVQRRQSLQLRIQWSVALITLRPPPPPPPPPLCLRRGGLEATADVQLLNIFDQTCFIKSSAFLTLLSLWDQARRKISSDNPLTSARFRPKPSLITTPCQMWSRCCNASCSVGQTLLV